MWFGATVPDANVLVLPISFPLYFRQLIVFFEFKKIVFQEMFMLFLYLRSLKRVNSKHTCDVWYQEGLLALDIILLSYHSSHPKMLHTSNLPSLVVAPIDQSLI